MPIDLAAGDTTFEMCCSKVIFESNVTPRITSNSDTDKATQLSSKTPCAGISVLDLLAMSVLVSIGFNYIIHCLHQSDMRARSLFRERATLSLDDGLSTVANRVESSA